MMRNTVTTTCLWLLLHRSRAFRASSSFSLRGDTTQLHLFFRKASYYNYNYASEPRIATLQSNPNLPFRIDQQPTTDEDAAATATSKNNSLTLRYMQAADIPALVDMCLDEYGQRTSAAVKWWQTLQVQIDRQCLAWLVDSSLRLKLSRQPVDHAILVASVNHNNQNVNHNKIVAMLEVSLQPVVPWQIPPAYALPRTVKTWWADQHGTTVEPWITNLLVVPAYRRQGIATLLVAAGEGVAACEFHSDAGNPYAVHLHCDATYAASKKLYQSLGYQPGHEVDDDNNNNDNNDNWQPPSLLQVPNSIYTIDGLDLLYLKKRVGTK